MRDSAVSDSETLCDWDDQFLTWFARQDIPTVERRPKLGKVEYYHFSSKFEVVGGVETSSFGSDTDRKDAAIKCAAEAIERQAMFRYFRSHGSELPKAFQNSNGWAVHRTEALAKKKAIAEAIERHLLLLSYCRFGWGGFTKVQAFDAPEMTINFLTSKYSNGGLRAGLVVSQSLKTLGVSFGHCLIKDDEAESGDQWQPALLESVDKLLIPSSPELQKKSWIERETGRYLSEPFDLSVFDSNNDLEAIESDIGDVEIEVFDLAEELNLNFPLFAAFVHGGNLIPLFNPSTLDKHSEDRLRRKLAHHGILEIPSRHPIL